jgi:hypothetical protein
MLISNNSIRRHKWQDPRDRPGHPDRGIRAPSCRQHHIRFRRSPRGTERFQEAGPRQFLLHGKFPRLESYPQAIDIGTGQDGERAFHSSR